MRQLEKGSKKMLNAWAFYDWANSVYPLVISSSIFPIFYAALFSEKEEIDFLGYTFNYTALITFVTAFAFLMVAILSPLLSGIADYVGNKKRYMQFFCYLGAFSCMGLYFFSLENLYFGIICYFLGLIGFWGSLVFYNSYLPDIAHKEQQDKVSAKGYSLGYIGSVILLVLSLFLVIGKEGEQAMEAMRWSFVFTGIWWVVFSQYTFYYLPVGNKTDNVVLTRDIFFKGFKELTKVKNQLFQNNRLKKYLRAFFVYSMAVQTVMLVATYFGEKEIAWIDDNQKTMGLIVSILLIQLVAVIGAFLTSRASMKYGNISVLIGINAIWIAICIIAYFVTTPLHFYITAAFVGLVMGGIQSLSRSTYAKFLPETNDTASFFSFYDVAEKVGIVIGMLLYGIIDQVTGSMRNSIVFLALFFIIGLILLLKVPQNQES